MLLTTITTQLDEIGIAQRLADEFAVAAAQDDRAAGFPFRHIEALRESGLLALTAPQQFGGRGGGLEIAAQVIREIGRGDPAIGLVLVMQYAHLALLHRGRWPAALVARVVRDAATEGALINALRVEPELGTPMRGGLPATVARRIDNGWLLSGRKIYSTGSEGLRWAIVWARTDEDEARVGQFLVPMQADGVRIIPTWDTLGLRASSSHDVQFDEVLLPPDYAVDIRRPAEWAVRGDETSAWVSLLIAALYTGVAEAGRDWIVAFLKSRVPANLGKPLAELPRMQEAVGAIEERIAVNRRLIGSAARDMDAGQVPAASQSGLIKHVATENAIAAVEGALKLAGNHGIARRNPLERHYRDVLCGRIHSPQEDSVLVAAGRAVLGL
ncbi:acyl-CoA dehydrogenase family protein [Paracoccus denitrificans]|jgi:alkylation response protein AidB-like acyl-CoA dehydrogenase|uniref:Acyl-CoA dehydrogenase, type 2, C-terminal domain n=1 Tax=Paracoccus denitrificans (strain Pd 1222) TaxID=318586 RepID=A1BC30_PARDP|nr:acyl-CoA dehydrogenase family protein [Paracoccus denitrificans]ABL73074.1 Acyl-CoA dehydrogenase, type 2, C-terminal domain [Paracoccus denitrificans PD1222]MBB4628449.1 alkylation response protein AidB-like acyl-CoA dehydrogenase [Paracoccus denitrificans]MCU7431145.1 acyl-CoA/acyl-ACP dehydrogenase [Paracoccus denitrificans]QAR29466.1 acyl-CoA dehydrogenase [Paracoccus denitrificans]UPV98206.1 acyl-CoA/acyl-ACP dehydrogenase [Paracoccus denitrificans]